MKYSNIFICLTIFISLSLILVASAEPVSNSKPVATIISISPETVFEGETISFSGTGTDDDGEVLAYYWTSNIDGFFSSYPSFSTSTLSVGTHTIYFSVEDNSSELSDVVQATVTVTEETVVDENQKPTAYITSISPNPATEGDSTKFTGYGADEDGVVTTYKWSSSIDGQLSTSRVFSLSDLSVGAHTITFSVRDDDGKWSDEVQVNLIVNETVATLNQKPTAYITSISPSPATDGDLIEFTGSGADEDGIVTTYKWTSSIDGQLSTSRVFSLSDLSVGVHTITFEVRDDDGKWSDGYSRPLTVNSNQKPIVSLSSITPNPATEGENVSFSGSGTDIDGNVTDYRWTSSLNGFLSSSPSFNISSLRVGTHTISLIVQDNLGEWSDAVSSSLVINEAPNKAPIAAITSITPNPTTQGSSVFFEGNATDSDGTITIYKWTSSIDGDLSSSLQFITSRLSLGNHTISFSVRDDEGSWSEEALEFLNITEIPNMVPNASIDSINPNPAYENTSVSFTGTGTDADGNITDYFWTSDLDGNLSNSSSFTTSNLSLGEHTISFSVQDNEGSWSEVATSDLSITEEPNDIPIASIVSITPSPADKRVSVSFEGNGTDVNGTVVAYYWSSSLDGYLSNASSFVTSNLSAGNHTIYFSVQDNKGAWSEIDSADLTVNDVPNKAPLAIIESISPNPQGEHYKVDFTGIGNDSDGTTVAYLWESSLDGILSTSASFNISSLSIGNHIISFIAMDNEGAWSEEVYSTLKITDTPNFVPEATINSISPDRSSIGDTVVFNGSGNDTFGYIVDYEWNSSIDGYLGNTAMLNVSTLSLGNHTIYFRVFDNEGAWSSADSMDILVEDGAPYVNIDADFTENISVNNPAPVTLYSIDMYPKISTFSIKDSTGNTILTEDVTDKINGGTYAFTWSTTDSSGTPLPSGTYTMNLISIDGFEQVNSFDLELTVDNTAPEIAINSIAGTNSLGQYLYANSELLVYASVSDDNTENVNLTLSSVYSNFEIYSNAVFENGYWIGSFDLSEIPDDGNYAITAFVEDGAKNTNSLIYDNVIIIDRDVPAISTTVSRISSSSAYVNIESSEELQDIPEVNVDGTTVELEVSDNGWRGIFHPDGTGTYNVYASGTDIAGNTGNSQSEAHISSIEFTAGTGTFADDDNDIIINFSTNDDFNEAIVVTESITSFKNLSNGSIGIHFMDVDIGDVLETNLLNATIFMKIDESVLPDGINTTDVAICNYNESEGNWEKLPTNILNVSGVNYWVTEVEHFSSYAAIAVDNVAPVLNSVTPSTGTTFGTSTDEVNIRFDYSDAQTGIDVDSIVLTFEGSDVTNSTASTITGFYASYNATGLSIGTYTAVVFMKDNAGNQASFKTKFKIERSGSSSSSSSSSGSGNKKTLSSSSSSGSSSGGSSSGEDYESILMKEAVSIFVNTGEHVVYEFRNEDNAISTIQFDSLKNSGKVKTTIEVLGETSIYADTEAPGNVYQQMNIFVGKTGFVSQENVENLAISFKVEKKWLEENEIEYDTVKLYRYSDNAWNSLPTFVMEENGDYVYFDSETTGFSPFAISAEIKETKTVAEDKSDSTSAGEETLKSTDTESTDEQPADTESKKSTIPIVALVAVGVIAVLGIAGFVVRKYVDIEL